MADTNGSWTEADLVALDLEGSGAQDHDDEAILEIATVPLAGGTPAVAHAYCTVVNPDRHVPIRPWTSPGLTTAVLEQAPNLDDVRPELAGRLDGRILVGHNVGVDWRLMHRRVPSIAPAGLLDTLRLARHLKLAPRLSLTALLDRFTLTAEVDLLAAGSQPHRALWDAVGVGLLLPTLIGVGWPAGTTLDVVMEAGSIEHADGTGKVHLAQPTLFG